MENCMIETFEKNFTLKIIEVAYPNNTHQIKTMNYMV